MEELMEDTTGLGYFVDYDVGVVFRRFKGGGPWDSSFELVVYETASEDVDCIKRAYPKYQTNPLK